MRSKEDIQILRRRWDYGSVLAAVGIMITVLGAAGAGAMSFQSLKSNQDKMSQNQTDMQKRLEEDRTTIEQLQSDVTETKTNVRWLVDRAKGR